MALCSLNDVKTVAGIPLATTTFDDALNMHIAASDAAIKRYCKRQLELATYTQYFDGNGRDEIILRQVPVVSITNIWVDATGAYGQGPTPFASDKLLTSGIDYYLVIDDEVGGTSKSGIVKRASIGASSLVPFNWGASLVLGATSPGWVIGTGNIKVTYQAGYATIPADLKQAAAYLANYMYITCAKSGEQYSSESLANYTYSLMSSAPSRGDLGKTRQLLSPYKDIVI